MAKTQTLVSATLLPHPFANFPTIHSLQIPKSIILHLHLPPLSSSRKRPIRSQLKSRPAGRDLDRPPSTKDEAINQARTCLLKALEKPLNNPRVTGKLKKQKQPRFRLEIPVIDESPQSLTGIAVELFGKIRIKRKGTPVQFVLFWSDSSFIDEADRALEPFRTVKHVELSTMKAGNRGGFSGLGDVVVFMAPDSTQLELVEAVCAEIDAKPVLIFNPKWGFDEESDFGRMGSFVSSFDVIYSFMGLEVRGVLSKRRGVVFKCDNGGWEVLMEEEGELKMVSRLKKRPSTVEVENVLYNLMAMNSPVTKSMRFLKDLVSRVGGRKE
ncbi:hypothetical protein AMTRI_Chr13g125220 [Amborella trichopoda]